MTLNDNSLAMAQSRYNVLLKRRQRMHRISNGDNYKKIIKWWVIYGEINKQMNIVSDLIKKIKGKPFRYPWSEVWSLNKNAS